MSMAPCRWVRDKEIGRFLVPGCYNRAVYGDDAECHCQKPDRKTLMDELDDIRARLRELEKGAGKSAEQRSLIIRSGGVE